MRSTLIFAFFLIGYSSIIYVASTRSINFTKIELSPYVVDYQWNKIEHQLKGQAIQEIVFKNTYVCSVGLQKILEADNVKKTLKSLRFQFVRGFNEKVMKTLCQSSILSNLTNLTLNSIWIQSNDLRYLPTDEQLLIEELSLQNNFIEGQGINYLSQLKLNYLKRLNLYGISLASEESVSALLKLQLDKLEQINIGGTAVSSDNTIRILSALDHTKLKSLNISKNSFEYLFFKNFSQFNFSSLKSLDIENLLIDEDSASFLKNMRFPELTTLNVGKNQIFVDGLYTFINKKNYPQLKNLIINNVIFHSDFFHYFSKEFGGTLFTKLCFNGHKVEPDIFEYLKRLDFSVLRVLQIRTGFMRPQMIDRFFDANQFQELEELNLEFIINSGDILHKILQKQWPRLKILKINYVGKIDFQKLSIQTSSIRFPNAQHISLMVSGYNSSQIAIIIQLLVRSCQKLIHLQITMPSTFDFIEGIVGKRFDFSKQVLLTVYKIIQDFFEPIKSEIFKGMFNPSSKPFLYQFNLQRHIQDQYSMMHLTPNFSENQFTGFFERKFNTYSEIFQFSEIRTIDQSENCWLLKGFLKKQQKKNQKCLFMHVSYLKLQDINDECYKIVTQCQFPNLNKLHLDFKNFTNLLNDPNSFLPQNFSRLTEFTIDNQKYIPNERVKEFFKHQQFACLILMYISSSDLRSNDISQIIRQNPNVRRVRFFLIFETWISDLSFINQNRMIFRYLDLTAEMIGNHLVELSKLNFQFLNYLRLAGDGITDSDLFFFIGNVSKTKLNAFPKIQSINLLQNQIGDEGTEIFLNSGMPMVESISMARNKNPNILNIILRSKTIHRLKKVTIYKNEQDSVDPSIQHKNTRQLQKFDLETADMQQQDFKALSKLDYYSLKRVYIQFFKYFQCNFLQHILKIAAAANKFAIFIKKGIVGASSECLKGKLVSDESLKHLIHLSIIVQQHIYSNMMKLFDLLIFDQALTTIVISGIYPSEIAMKRLSTQTNLDQIQQLILSHNDITDQMVHGLLNRELKELRVLNLAGNNRLTSKSIRFMKNRVYPQLQLINLDSTQIDDQGVKILLSCDFPKLRTLSLQNTDISHNSMEYLSNLAAPNLNILDISNNGLTFVSLSKFSPAKFKYLVSFTIYPFLESSELQKLNELYNKDREKPTLIQISSDVLYHQIVSGDQNQDSGNGESSQGEFDDIQF